MLSQLYLIRHGQTAWSRSGQHTGRTEIPLTKQGEREALRLAEPLRAVSFDRVLSSPRQRAWQTCKLVGLAEAAELEPDLAEWDYGDYEGQRTADIRQLRPDWNLFQHGCPHGESPGQIAERADRLIARLRTMEGTLAVFTHGHFGRALAARWIGLTVVQGQLFLLDTGSFSILGYNHQRAEEPVIVRWNVIAQEK